MPYGKFIEGLAKAGIVIDRKALAELAIVDMPAFAQLVEKARPMVTA